MVRFYSEGQPSQQRGIPRIPTLTCTLNMPRQRQPESQSKRPKSRAEESASQISKTTGVSTKAPETSGDLKDPSLSRRRPASHVATSPEPSSTTGEEEPADMDLQNMSRKSQWLILAVGSGACAAFNGVFAKLYVVYLTPLLCFLGFRSVLSKMRVSSIGKI